jgi:glycerol-3-phosphate acyltransferase PlsY
LGHAYSPFLRFRGGKALAVSLGTWGGLLIGEGPVVLVTLLLIWYTIVTVDGWAVLLTVLSFLLYLLLTDKESSLLVLWAGNALLLTWKYHPDLEQVPRFRLWLRKLLPLQPVRAGRKQNRFSSSDDS